MSKFLFSIPLFKKRRLILLYRFRFRFQALLEQLLHYNQLSFQLIFTGLGHLAERAFGRTDIWPTEKKPAKKKGRKKKADEGSFFSVS